MMKQHKLEDEESEEEDPNLVAQLLSFFGPLLALFGLQLLLFAFDLVVHFVPLHLVLDGRGHGLESLRQVAVDDSRDGGGIAIPISEALLLLGPLLLPFALSPLINTFIGLSLL